MKTEDKITLIHIDKEKLSRILEEAYGSDCITIKSFNVMQGTISFFNEERIIIEDDNYKAEVVIEKLIKKYGNKLNYMVLNYPNLLEFTELRINNIEPSIFELEDIAFEYGVNYRTLVKLFYPNTEIKKI